MGDVGRGLYVSPDVVPVYKRILQLADIITPNQFEVEYVRPLPCFGSPTDRSPRLLSGTTITDLASLRTALARLHTDHALPHIAFSSIPLRRSVVDRLQLPAAPDSYTRLLPPDLPSAYRSAGQGGPEDEVLVCFASTYETEMETWAFALPTIDIPFTGTGDLLSALCTAWYRKDAVPDADRSSMPHLAWAVSKALLTVQQILLKTYTHMLQQQECQDESMVRKHGSDNQDIRAKAMHLRSRELRLVPERGLIAEPGPGWAGRRVDWQTVAG